MEQRQKWKRLGWEGSVVLLGALAVGASAGAASCDDSKTSGLGAGGAGHIGGGGSTGTGSFAGDDVVVAAAQSVIDGRKMFRFDTFGDEAFWGDTLKLHLAIAGSANGGVGPGVSPKTALAVGLKVDAEALPRGRRGGASRPARSTSMIRRRRWRCSS